MEKNKLKFFLIFLCMPLINWAQEDAVKAINKACNCMGNYKSGKGTFYISWGYNKDYFTKSDIHLYNSTSQSYPNARDMNGYNFTIKKAKATDRPRFNELFSSDLSIPQYSYRLGYYFNDSRNLGIEINFDHAKYVMVDDQYVRVRGVINGKFYNVDTLVSTDFLKFEHTNGANFLMINFLKRRTLLKSTNQQHWLSVVIKTGAGIVIPKTDVTLWGERLDNRFHIAGYIAGADIGLRYDLYKYFFFETSGKGVFANYMNVLTIGSGKANHHFFAYEWLGSLGFQFPL
jgi:hypothetical protein